MLQWIHCDPDPNDLLNLCNCQLRKQFKFNMQQRTWKPICGIHDMYILFKKQETQLPQRDRATRYFAWSLVNPCKTVRIKSAKLTATILHQWIGEWFRLFYSWLLYCFCYLIRIRYCWRKCVESAILRWWVTSRLNFRLKGYVSRWSLWTVR